MSSSAASASASRALLHRADGHADLRPLAAGLGPGVAEAEQTPAGDPEGRGIGVDPGRGAGGCDAAIGPGRGVGNGARGRGAGAEGHGGDSVAVERKAEHRRTSRAREHLAAHGLGGGTVVHGHEGEAFTARPAVDHGGQAGGGDGVDDGVVVGGGPDDEAVDGRLGDPVDVGGASGDGDEGQRHAVVGADPCDAGQETGRLRVVEGIGEVLAEDDAQGAGTAPAQRARSGMRARVAEALGGLADPGPGVGGDPLGLAVGVGDGHHRHPGRMGDLHHGRSPPRRRLAHDQRISIQDYDLCVSLHICRFRGAPVRARTACVSFAAFGGFWGVWGASVPAIRAQAEIGDGQLGTALLFVGAGALPTMLATGGRSDRWGYRVTAALLVVLGAVGVGVAATARDFLSLSAGLALLGASSGAADVAINAAAGSAERAAGRPVVIRAHGSSPPAWCSAASPPGCWPGLADTGHRAVPPGRGTSGGSGPSPSRPTDGRPPRCRARAGGPLRRCRGQMGGPLRRGRARMSGRSWRDRSAMRHVGPRREEPACACCPCW